MYVNISNVYISFMLSILLFVVIGNHPLNECEILWPTRAPYIFISLANNNHRDDIFLAKRWYSPQDRREPF